MSWRATERRAGGSYGARRPGKAKVSPQFNNGFFKNVEWVLSAFFSGFFKGLSKVIKGSQRLLRRFSALRVGD